MEKELFGEVNLAVKFAREKNTLTQSEFELVQEFYAWLAAQQSVERTPVDIGDGVMVDPLILGAILD